MSKFLTKTLTLPLHTSPSPPPREAEKKTLALAQELAILPPLEPIPTKWFLLLMFITMLPIAAYVLGFSAIG